MECGVECGVEWGAHLFPLNGAYWWARGWGQGHLTDNGEGHFGLATLGGQGGGEVRCVCVCACAHTIHPAVVFYQL